MFWLWGLIYVFRLVVSSEATRQAFQVSSLGGNDGAPSLQVPYPLPIAWVWILNIDPLGHFLLGFPKFQQYSNIPIVLK
jgi:hypothetical protein